MGSSRELAGAQADGVRTGALDDLDPRRKLEQQLQPVDGAIGAHLEHGVDLGRLERTFRCQAELDRESRARVQSAGRSRG